MKCTLVSIFVLALPWYAFADGHGPVFGLATPTNSKGEWSFDSGVFGRSNSFDTEASLREQIGYGFTPHVTLFFTAPVVFGDGLRCAGGALKRLYTKTAASGSITAPQAGDPTVSARSAALGDPIPLGATRVYHTYYRDPNLGFCPAGFNATNAIAQVWGS